MKPEIKERIDKINRGQVPEGYKRTEVGIIPKDWEVQKLGAVVNFLDHMRKPIKEGDRKKGIYPYYGASGIIDYVDDYIFDGSYILLGEDGANILTRSSPLAFKVSGKIWVNNHAHIMEPKVPTDIDYITYYLESIRYEKYNTGTAQPKITQEVCQRIPIPFSKLIDERWKIGKILSTWDKAIELKEKLIEQKKEQKKGLMQRLLTGKVRLPGFKGEWVKVEFGKVMKFPKKKPVDKPEDYYLLTVKLHLKGIEATNKKPNVTSKGRPYFLREPGELLIGRQNFHNGGIGIVPEGMTGYVASNAISSIVAIKGNIKFYYYYMSNKNFFKRVEHLIGGTGQKEISESMLKKLKLVIPPTEKEQDAIVEVLTLLDKEIELLDNELSNLKQQKKGLMQLLLTGKVRVKC